MKYLLDTNIWLELLLNQERAAEVSDFLDRTSSELIAISDFTLHSIGVILCRHSKLEIFKDFIVDLFENGSITQFLLTPTELSEIPDTIQHYKLDFDDSYQFLISKNYNLQIVSFDNDFERAGVNTKTPSELD
jgi:predicted nucleic acid-binding protein